MIFILSTFSDTEINKTGNQHYVICMHLVDLVVEARVSLNRTSADVWKYSSVNVSDPSIQLQFVDSTCEA
jgi:hypothetical protein